MIVHYTLSITGQVQKVGFRFRVNVEASRLNLLGYVKNEADGSVTVEVEGEEESVNHFLQWCRMGPPKGAIDKMDLRKGPVAGYTEFLIRH